MLLQALTYKQVLTIVNNSRRNFEAGLDRLIGHKRSCAEREEKRAQMMHVARLAEAELKRRDALPHRRNRL